MLNNHHQVCPNCQKEMKRMEQLYNRKQKIRKINGEK